MWMFVVCGRVLISSSVRVPLFLAGRWNLRVGLEPSSKRRTTDAKTLHRRRDRLRGGKTSKSTKVVQPTRWECHPQGGFGCLIQLGDAVTLSLLSLKRKARHGNDCFSPPCPLKHTHTHTHTHTNAPTQTRRHADTQTCGHADTRNVHTHAHPRTPRTLRTPRTPRTPSTPRTPRTPHTTPHTTHTTPRTPRTTTHHHAPPRTTTHTTHP